VLFKQALIELDFNYIKEKYKLVLNLKYSIPNMKYKGTTVQYQRVRAKKAPKI